MIQKGTDPNCIILPITPTSPDTKKAILSS